VFPAVRIVGTAHIVCILAIVHNLSEYRILRNAMTDQSLKYQLGFGNEFETEAEPGALPVGQNSPQILKYGLVSELVSGTTFAAPRALNRRTYLFRIRPSVVHNVLERIDAGNLMSAPFSAAPNPNQMRWRGFQIPRAPTDFVQGLFTICGNGDVKCQSGVAIHTYLCNRSMVDKAFSNADGEMLFIAQLGDLRFVTEMGILDVSPGDLLVIPRGVKFRVELLHSHARGYVCENYGVPFRLPELGLIGSTGLANAYDFYAPTAAYEDMDRPTAWVHKFGGNLWQSALQHSPFDVVAWRGNNAPYKFNMRRFAAMGTVSVDHPDPSIYCALSSPSDLVAGANADLMILPERWLVAEHTLRPPGFHRNSVAEFLSIVAGKHDSKSSSFAPGDASLHNNWSPHGPDMGTLDRGRTASLAPQKLADTLVFMIESRFPLQVTPWAFDAPERERNYTDAWQGYQKSFNKQNA
jgi:homogentisate 1,2-dioxygenase